MRTDGTRSAPTRHAFVHFTPIELPDDWPPLASWPVLRLMAPGDSVRPLFRRMLDEWCDGTRREARPTRTVSRIMEALLDSFLVHPEDLCRLFAASVGRSPMETVRLMRLERALVLLARSNLSVKEVGRLSGFSSPNHFLRGFRSV